MNSPPSEEKETVLIRWTLHGVADHLGHLEAIEGELLGYLRLAREAASQAYAPYSNFRVGCIAVSGERLFSGSNVENASYGATMCAERVALFSAVATGCRSFDWLVISTIDSAHSPDLSLRSPCGLCRQVMGEFFDERTLIAIDGGSLIGQKEAVDLVTIDVVFPWRFRI